MSLPDGGAPMDVQGNARIYRVLFFLAISIAFGFLAFRILKPFLGAMAWAVVLATAFNGPWRALERRSPRRRGLAAGLMTLALALLVLLPAGVFAGLLASQAVAFAAEASQRLQAANVQSFSGLAA